MVLAVVVAFLLPNTQQFLRRYRPALGLAEFGNPTGKRRWWEWRPTALHAGLSVILLYVTFREFDKLSEFIYFQF